MFCATLRTVLLSKDCLLFFILEDIFPPLFFILEDIFSTSINKWCEESCVQLLFFRKLPSLDFSVRERRMLFGHLVYWILLKKTCVFSE